MDGCYPLQSQKRGGFVKRFHSRWARWTTMHTWRTRVTAKQRWTQLWMQMPMGRWNLKRRHEACAMRLRPTTLLAWRFYKSKCVGLLRWLESHFRFSSLTPTQGGCANLLSMR